MTPGVQWIIVAAIVAAAVVCLIRKGISAAKDPCAGCDLAASCRNKEIKKDCHRQSHQHKANN